MPPDRSPGAWISWLARIIPEFQGGQSNRLDPRSTGPNRPERITSIDLDQVAGTLRINATTLDLARVVRTDGSFDGLHTLRLVMGGQPPDMLDLTPKHVCNNPGLCPMPHVQ